MLRLLFLTVLMLMMACGDPPARREATSQKPRGHVSQAEFGDKWPLTVQEGVLNCTAYPPIGSSRVIPKAVTFRTSDGQVYGVNGTAMDRGFTPVEAIQRMALPLFKFTPLERLLEERRKEVYAALVRCEDEADKKGEQRFPNDLKRQIAEQEKLSEACGPTIQKQFKLTAEELYQVRMEGTAIGWFPMSPTRMDVSPLINRGLGLCP